MAVKRIARNATGATAWSGNASGLAVDSDTDQLQVNVDGTVRKLFASRLIAAGGTKTLTSVDAGSIVLLDTAAGSVVTLPAATGTGDVYKFLVTVTATSNSHVIKVAAASTNEMRGYVIQDASEATAPNTWWAADDDDTITLNRSTTGLAAQGEYFELIDATSGHWFVRGYSQASGTEATPFSATV